MQQYWHHLEEFNRLWNWIKYWLHERSTRTPRSDGAPFLMRLKRNYFESSNISFFRVFLSSSSSSSCSYSVFSICLFLFHHQRHRRHQCISITSFCHSNSVWIKAVCLSFEYVYFITYNFYCLSTSPDTIRNRDIKFAQYLHISFYESQAIWCARLCA